MISNRTVTVFGAYGHTGRFIVTELRKRGWTPILSGRDANKLNAMATEHRDLEARPASVDSPGTLDRALAGAALVINCAGPFLDTADPILEAALRAGVHYLDVTAEQASAAATYERFDATAQKAGLVVVPAMGFYGGLADLLATAALGDWATADEIRIGIALDSWRPTQGTRITGQRNKARRLIIANGALAPLPDPAPTDSWKFPEPFGAQEVVELPFSETILIARHLHVSALHTYLNITPLKDLRDPATPAPTPADEMGRSAQTFLVDVIVKNGSDTRRATARGRDIYAVTAPLVVEAAQRILDGSVRRRGVLAPGEIFDASTFLRALAPQHLLLEI
jgi:NAD(P)-dependent dehydrogenase (short-subunit alcohol dehydrogenase family)